MSFNDQFQEFLDSGEYEAVFVRLQLVWVAFVAQRGGGESLRDLRASFCQRLLARQVKLRESVGSVREMSSGEA